MAMLGVLLTVAPRLLYAPQFCLGAFGLDEAVEPAWANALGPLDVDSFNVQIECTTSGQLCEPTFPHTFDTAGEFDYYCKIHPEMQSSVTVTTP